MSNSQAATIISSLPAWKSIWLAILRVTEALCFIVLILKWLLSPHSPQSHKKINNQRSAITSILVSGEFDSLSSQLWIKGCLFGAFQILKNPTEYYCVEKIKLISFTLVPATSSGVKRDETYNFKQIKHHRSLDSGNRKMVSRYRIRTEHLLNSRYDGQLAQDPESLWKHGLNAREL